MISSLSELIRSIATLLWPLIVFFLIMRYNDEFRDLLKRLRKGKLLGQEIELDPKVRQLNVTIETAASETPLQSIQKDSGEFQTGNTNAIEDILNEIKNSPKTALIKLSIQIESELRILLAQSGLLDISPISMRNSIKLLQERGALPPALTSSLDQFMQVRNMLIHGLDLGESNENILSAIDSGIYILKMIRAIPHEINVVYATNVPVFEDAECKKIRPDIKALILETKSPGGARTSYRIFPTTRNNYIKGRPVSWHWNMHRSWGESWYRDPTTDEIKEAWTASAEFVGKHLDEIQSWH